MKSETQRTSRTVKNRRAVLLRLLIVVFCVSCLILAAIAARGAESLLRKFRYTSICVRCGFQQGADFLYLLDNQVYESDYMLALSDDTTFPGRDAANCEHAFTLVGKSSFTLWFDGAIQRFAQGQPHGDHYFAQPRLKEFFAAFHQSNPEMAFKAMEQIAKQRYAGVTLDLALWSIDPGRNRSAIPHSPEFSIYSSRPAAPGHAPTTATPVTIPASSVKEAQSAAAP